MFVLTSSWKCNLVRRSVSSSIAIFETPPHREKGISTLASHHYLVVFETPATLFLLVNKQSTITSGERIITITFCHAFFELDFQSSMALGADCFHRVQSVEDHNKILDNNGKVTTKLLSIIAVMMFILTASTLVR